MADANLVLDTFMFDPKAKYKVVELKGRKSGIMGFILSKLGLGMQSYLTVTRDHVEFRFVSLSGITTILCPLDTLTSANCAAGKPVWALWLGIVLLLGSIPAVFSGIGIVGLIISGILLYHFYRTRLLTLTFSTGEMLSLHGLDFAAFTKDGKRITLEQLLQIVNYINVVLLNVRPDPIDTDENNAPLTTMEWQVVSDDIGLSTVDEIPEIDLTEVKATAGKMLGGASNFLNSLSNRLQQESSPAKPAPGSTEMKPVSLDSTSETALEFEEDPLDSILNPVPDPPEPPVNVEVLVRQAIELFQTEQYKDALPLLQQAYAHEPQNFDAVMGMGMCYQKTGNHTQAVRYFLEAADIKPRASIIWKRLAASYRALNKAEEYEHAIAQAQRLST